MKFGWMKAKGSKEGDDKTEIEIPDEIGKNLDKLKDFDPSANKTMLDSLKASMDALNARFTKEDTEADEEKKRKARELAAKAATETDEQIQELFLTDPAAATALIVKKATEPQSNVILTLRADNLKREVFEDQEKYPYYTGDIKTEIDKLLDGETLVSRNNRNVIEHAYHSTVGKHIKEINEGKLKDRFASSQGSRGTKDNINKGPDDKTPLVITDDIRKIAEMFGQKPEDYAKEVQEAGIGYV